MRISWNEKKSNQKVIEMVGYKRSLLKTIRKDDYNFLAYKRELVGLEKQILSGNICGRQRRQHTNTQTV